MCHRKPLSVLMLTVFLLRRITMPSSMRLSGELKANQVSPGELSHLADSNAVDDFNIAGFHNCTLFFSACNSGNSSGTLSRIML